MSCNKCNEETQVTYHKCKPCQEVTTCECTTKLETKCITYEGNDLECSGIKKGTILTELLQQLDAFICKVREDLINSFTLKNIGLGAKIYKGLDLLGRRELRTIIKTGELITVVENENDVSISIDEQELADFVKDSQKIIVSPDDSITVVETDTEFQITTTASDTNFAENNLTFSGNRTHDLASKTVHYNNAKQVKSTVNVIQPVGEASYEETGFGSAVTDIIKRIFNGAGAKIVEIFGNKAVKFYGNIWSNGLSNNSSNTVFGEDAFISNSVGLRNSTFGFNSLKNATGNDNTAFGMQSLMNLTTGIQNTAVGMEAGFSIVDGVQNTAMGYGAMNQSGADSSFNTVVGFASLTRTVDEVFITESYRCTILGNDVKVDSGNLTPTNQIIIGDVAMGEGDNTAVIGSIDTEVLYIPRHTTVEINTFTGMSTGALVFNTTLNTLCFYNGASWQQVTTTPM